MLSSTKFIRCDVTNWDDQVELFKTALDISPNKSIDYVLANAGILGTDDILTYDCKIAYAVLLLKSHLII